MKFTKKIPYALKCAVPTAMVAAATMFGGCQKEENPKRDIELNFTATYGFELSIENIKNKLADPTVNKIYLRLVDEGSAWYRPGDGWVYPEDVRAVLEPRVKCQFYDLSRYKSHHLFDQHSYSPRPLTT